MDMAAGIGLPGRVSYSETTTKFSCQTENQAPRRVVWRELGPPRGASMEDTIMSMQHRIMSLWHEEQGQDIAEYAVMLAVILVIVVGTIRLIGSNANNVFSSVASSIK
jgi:Flp pilus assembly pilin Flp